MANFCLNTRGQFFLARSLTVFWSNAGKVEAVQQGAPSQALRPPDLTTGKSVSLYRTVRGCPSRLHRRQFRRRLERAYAKSASIAEPWARSRASGDYARTHDRFR